MKRYLIDIVKNKLGTVIHVFQVSENVTYENVSNSENTIAFFFVKSNKEKEEIEASYTGIRIGNIQQIEFGFNTDEVVLEENIYLIGKEANINGKRACLNRHGAFIIDSNGCVAGLKTIIVEE